MQTCQRLRATPMQFRDYASTETSALVSQVLEGRDQALHELDSFRQLLEEAGRRVDQVVSRLHAMNGADGVPALVEKLAAAANAGAQTLVQRAQADAQAQLQRLQTDTEALIERVRAEAQATLEQTRHELQQELAAQADQTAQLTAALEEAQASVESLRADREAAIEREEAAIAREQAATEREKAAAAREKTVRAELSSREKAISGIEKTAAEREKALRAELSSKLKASPSADQAVAEREKAVRAELSTQIRELNQRLEAAQAEVARAREQLAADSAGRSRLASEGDRAQFEPSQGRHERSIDQLLTVFHEIATGESVPEVLVRLARGLEADFRRVALFNVKGKRLEGVYQKGFDFASDISKLALPLAQESLLASAIESGHVEARAAGEKRVAAPPPFDSGNGCAIALPVVVRGHAVGVIFADDADHPAAEAAPLEDRIKVAEILQRHALPRVEALVIEQRTLDELRAYAKLLLDEVEHMYAADAASGTKEADLQSRLKENVECALQIYGQRVASESPAAASLLEDRLAEVLDAKRDTPFGRDLSVVAARKPKKQTTQRKAGAR